MSQKQTNVNQFNKFLENNQDFLEQKFMEHFKKKSIPIKDFKNEPCIKYIYDVFSFTKYESDEKMNKTLKKSLTTNINDYLQKVSSEQKKGVKFDFNLPYAVQLLKYCIENNEMFAVKYDKKDKKMKTQNPQGDQQETVNQQPDQLSQQQQKQQQKSDEQPDNIKEQPDSNKEDKQENIQEQPKQLQEEQMANEFEMSKSQQKIVDPQLIKKNLKEVFGFYCKQQQNVGANTTFDRISQECQTMTLGKFLSFAITSGIKNEKIDKNLMIRKFKLNAEGKKQINFEKFYQLIRVLAAIDESLIPKLGLDDKTAFRDKMKAKSMAFNTKDQTFRELKKPHIFIPKLTGHSGKLSDALFEEMKNRKQSRIATSLMRKPSHIEEHIYGTPNKGYRYNISKLQHSNINNTSQMISPKELASSNIRDFNEDVDFLEKMINMEEGDEEWLKDYKINKKDKSHLAHKGATTFLPSIKSKSKAPVMLQLERSETRQSVNFNRKMGFQHGARRQRSSLA